MAPPKRPSIQILRMASHHLENENCQLKLSASNLHQSSSALPLGLSRHSKSTKKPTFQVYCDPSPIDSMSMSSQNGSSTCDSNFIFSSSGSLQTVVNNKENQVPELEDKLLSQTRHHSRNSNRINVLEEKSCINSGVNCVEKWNSKIPFAPCSPESLKSTRGHFYQPKGKNGSRVDYESNPMDKLASTIFLPELEIENTMSIDYSAKQSSSHTVIWEVNTLVAKLEALETCDQTDIIEIFDPLPTDATCPGAPKLPATFTMPFFDAGDSDEAEERFTFKSPSPHQMSPLAEVTEAYTGLQGGWSPSFETLSPMLDDSPLFPIISNDLDSISIQLDIHYPKAQDKKLKSSKKLETETKRDLSAPRPKRRREVVSSQTESSTKALLRI
ncbi:hypothetical protein O181_055369 [Austropuccinia psidii MF-1]|uniref:Uncharacterized protein n=1 Tax=Austropuccinia psidii MF-1 TaxID=1389203 RepID=A0A9Q3E6C1_9BASI|nr:hypothetical protein [Austropuccinia psidii MF-1]